MQKIILDMYKTAHAQDRRKYQFKYQPLGEVCPPPSGSWLVFECCNPDGIPDADAGKFSTLISMDNVGNYKLTPILPRLIAKYETALTERKAARARAAAKRPAHRRAKRPRLA